MIKSTKVLTIISLAVAVMSVTAFEAVSAGPGHGHRHGGGWHGPKHGPKHGPRLMKRFDTNRDGKLTQQEINQARADRLARFDVDGDRRLTLKEFEALWLDRARPRMVDGFQFLDRDGDGVVTGNEYFAPFASIVIRKDRNGDGELSYHELRSRRHAKQHRNRR